MTISVKELVKRIETVDFVSFGFVFMHLGEQAPDQTKVSPADRAHTVPPSIMSGLYYFNL